MQYPDGAKVRSILGPQVSAAHAGVDFVLSPSKKGRVDAPHVVDSERMVLMFSLFHSLQRRRAGKMSRKVRVRKNHQSLRLTRQGHWKTGEYVDEENSLNQYLGFLAQWEPGLDRTLTPS